MTAETTEPAYLETEVAQLPGADTDRDTSQDRPPFRLGDDDTVLIGKRPKLAVLLKLMNVMNNDADPMAQAAGLDQFIDRVLTDESAAYLRSRLEDEDDDLDLDSPGFSMMFQYLVGLWYAGPTGSPAGSPRSRTRTGQRSTGRRPSKGKTR